MLMALRMCSSTFLVVLSSLVLSGLCRSSLSNQQEVRVIKTKNGVYDCVEFYKQPAFNHPLLKNLTSKVIPKFPELQGRKVSGFGLKDGGCPRGSVPILRTNPNSKDFPQPPSHPNQWKAAQCLAIVQTIEDDPSHPTKKFYGIDGSISLYKPSVRETQWSTGRLKLINANDYIEAGWMVNPSMFHDHEAHLYAKFKMFHIGCVNLQCPGFVQVATDLPLGIVPEKYSVVGGQQWIWNISIDKHQDDGNWWLSITDRKYQIGYYPKQLFATLGEFATQATWGGEVNTGTLPVQLPEMGTGAKATYNLKLSAFILHVTVVDESFKNVNPRNTEKFRNCREPYTVLDGGYHGGYRGRFMFFGGPWDY